jgi:hypothetical protein
MKVFLAVLISVGLVMSAQPIFAKKSKRERVKEIRNDIVASEAYQAAKDKIAKKLQKEANCTNAQGGNHANSTAAVRKC